MRLFTIPVLAMSACLLLSGFANAQPVFTKKKNSWPLGSEGLVFSLVSGNLIRTPTVAFEDNGNKSNQTDVIVRGFDSNQPTARYDQNFALWPDGGSFLINDGMPFVIEAIKKSGSLTLEAWIVPADPATSDGTILALQGNGSSDFTHTQNKEAIVLTLTREGKSTGLPLVKLATPKPLQLTVTIGKDGLQVYVNGQPQGSGTPIPRSGAPVQGDLAAPVTASLSIGDNITPGHPWQGTIEGIALFSRALAANEVKADAEAYANEVAKRKPPQICRVKATLLKRSPAPDPKSILPYVQAMLVDEYHVDQVLEGACPSGVIRVYTWGIMEKQVMPIAGRPEGKSYDLVLGRVEENPWLESQWVDNSLPDKPEVPIFYDITPNVR